MPPPALGKLIARYGESWLNADALGVPRGPCRMCRTCPGFPGDGSLPWPGEEEQATAETERCRRCGCPGHQHQNLELWLSEVMQRAIDMRCIVSWYRPLPPQARLPMAAPGWSCTGAALFALTEGGFDPRVHSVKGRRPSADGPSKKISVIAPTSFARHAFHPLLYECFRTQDYVNKELIVVDTGPEPSSFFQELDDPRIIYRHFRVADSRLDLPEGWKQGAPVIFGHSDQEHWQKMGLEPKAWSLGMKRNVAIELSCGEIIAHFDDDDLYAPCYLSTMQELLEKLLSKQKDAPSEPVSSSLPPAAVTLKAWHLLDLSDMTFGFMDVEHDPLLPKDQRFGWLFGWGFSYVFTRACWELTPVPDVEWSEDISFYEELRRRKVPVSPVRPSKVICAHSYHAKVNISGGEFSGALRCGDPIDMDSAELLALLPLAQAAERRISAERSRDQSVGEKCGFRVSLSEKKEFLQCRGQAWFTYQRQKIAERKGQSISVKTWH